MSAATTPKRAKGKAAQSDPEVLPPEEFVVRDKPKAKSVPTPPDGMYPEGTELFSFTSKATGETIWFPMKFEQPNAVWVWSLYDKPFHVQTWEWMIQAEVPKAMQRSAVHILDEDPSEYMDLFNAWLGAAGGTTPGE